jgi:hypothetical protein
MAAVALIGTSALSGSAVLTGSATAAPEMHTKRLVLHNTAERNVGKFTFVGSDTVRSRSSGKVVGYDTISGKFYPREEKIVVQIAFALKGGIIVSRVSAHSAEGVSRFDGRILKGSGRYLGIDGEIEGRFPQGNSNKVFVTLHYHV